MPVMLTILNFAVITVLVLSLLEAMRWFYAHRLMTLPMEHGSEWTSHGDSETTQDLRKAPALQIDG